MGEMPCADGGSERTTIELSKATRERLKRAGRKNESYDDLINRVLDERGVEPASLKGTEWVDTREGSRFGRFEIVGEFEDGPSGKMLRVDGDVDGPAVLQESDFKRLKAFGTIAPAPEVAADE